MKPSKPPGTRLIRNSTAEILFFTWQVGGEEYRGSVRGRDGLALPEAHGDAVRRGCANDQRASEEHLRHASGELEKGSVVRNIRTNSDGFELLAVGQPGAVALDGARAVEHLFRRHVDGGCCRSILGHGVLGEFSSMCLGLKNRWFG